MKYYIDGHNLIPKMYGMSLSDFDDEEALIRVLNDYGRISRCSLTVFFDQAPDEHSGVRTYGNVRANFVSYRKKADEAIFRAVQKEKARAREIIVVSSDLWVQSECRALGTQTETSESFAKKITRTLDSAQIQTENRDRKPSSEEIDEWLKLFGG